VTELEQSGRIPGRPDDPDAVAVLTPYRAQRDLVRGRLPAALLSRGLTVDTVHTYQGDEAGTVILDMVDARGLPVTPFLRSSDRSSTGSRLFNVAATRPRRRLIAVCPLRFALRSASRGPVREFVDYLQKHATRIHLPLDLAHKALAFVHEWEQGSGR
jgi:superfamily I DNA and/or RNA helicase